MKLPWVIVGGTGYDVEDLDDPQTRDMECPSCEKHVRFVEKVLIKNLRVFGVPLVGVEKGRRVFECPRCQTCVEPPAEDPAIEAAQKHSAAAASLHAQLTRAQDEQWLWEKRADLASQNGDMELAADAMKLREKAAREVERLKAESERALAKSRTLATAPAAAMARPAVVARAGAAGVEPTGTDEFAALKARIARKHADEAETAKTAVSIPDDESARERASEDRMAAERDAAASDAESADGFAALKKRLAAKSAEPEPSAARPAFESSIASAPSSPGPSTPREATSIDEEFATLLRKRESNPATTVAREPADRDAYEALKREIVEGPAAGAKDAAAMPVTPPATEAPDDDHDPAAALKRKLRKR